MARHSPVNTELSEWYLTFEPYCIESGMYHFRSIQLQRAKKRSGQKKTVGDEKEVDLRIQFGVRWWGRISYNPRLSAELWPEPVELVSQKLRHPSNIFLRRSRLDLARILERFIKFSWVMFRQYRISAPLLSSIARVHSWSHHGGEKMPTTKCFFSGNMSSTTDSMTWDRASAPEVETEGESLGQNGARSGEQKDKSNALGFECGLARRVGVPLFRMKRWRLFIMSTKVLSVDSTPPQSQRGKGNMISDYHSCTAVSIRSVVSKADETRHSKVTARPQPCLRHSSNGGEFWAELASRGMSALSVKTGHFVLPHGTKQAYMHITVLKTSRLRSTLYFSMPISAAVIALDRWVSAFDRQSIVTEKHSIRQRIPIKGKHNSLGRFPDSGAIYYPC
ncbi:hypothetical protein EVAR_64220_1 [Eumeta japonica]|uniref:Uncharacterized protein n=1 Tax=Eumeta variegata TaxID=151549 RepID=A0A4C1YYE8_EUMVA|nr:hypothetical protein EVAR_64220_1 [Eumeta japonica]